jgi:hypothetical protein
MKLRITGTILIILFLLIQSSTSFLALATANIDTSTTSDQIITLEKFPMDHRFDVENKEVARNSASSIVDSARNIEVKETAAKYQLGGSKLDDPNNPDPNSKTDTGIYDSHLITASEVFELKARIGIRDPNMNYNLLVNGIGTGLAPPTEDEWNEMIGNIEVVESVSNVALPTYVDHSQSPYFPIVRSQGSMASCAAWITTYYAHGYYQAREFGWTEASLGNNSQLLNPSWTYNKVAKGIDSGSTFWRNWKVLNTVGAVKWSTMPYNSKDCFSFGLEAAWREAPLYRAGNYRQTEAVNIDVVRSWLNDGYLSYISIDSGEYDGLGVNDSNITSLDYNSTTTNHGNAVVGYDDNRIVDGERGAFKIVNSWGANWGTTWGGRNNSGGWNGSGYYWITYKAFTNLVKPVYSYYDLIDYEPSLTATWTFEGHCSSDAAIYLYLNSTSSPHMTRYVYRRSGNLLYPKFMCLDITEFKDFAGLKPIYLKVFSGVNKTNVTSFKLEQYNNGYSKNNASATKISGESTDTPKMTPCTVKNTITGYQIRITTPDDNDYHKDTIQTLGTTDFRINETLLTEDFENEFPGDWIVGDADISSGNDYWGNTTARANSGFHSGWCAKGSEPIFEEDFDTGSLRPIWTTYSENLTTSEEWFVNNTGYDFVYNGSDYAAICDSNKAGTGTNITEWLYTNTAINASEYSYLYLEFLLAYDHNDGNEYAEVLYANTSSYPTFFTLRTWSSDTFGPQRIDLSSAAGEEEVYLAFRYHGTYDHYMLVDDIRVITNHTNDEYDPNMVSYMYQSVNLSRFDMVNLSYDYWLDAGPVNDSLNVIFHDGLTWNSIITHTGSSSGWVFNNVIIPKNAIYVGFQFESDSTLSNYEGAYLDNIVLIGYTNLTSISVRIDTGTWNVLPGTTSWMYNINTKSHFDGTHTYSARATFGSYFAYDEISIIIDNSPPESFTPIATPSSWSPILQPVITFEAVDVTSGIDYYKVKVGNGLFNIQTSPYTLPLLEEGIYPIIVRAYDLLGHTRDGSVLVYIDNSNPESFTPTATPSSWTSDRQPVIHFETTDLVSDVMYYTLKIDSGNFSNQTSPYTLPVQTDGIHLVTVRGYDQADNFVEGYVEVYIDTTPPESFNAISEAINWTRDTSPEITFSTTDSVSEIDHYKVKIDNGEFSTQASPYTTPALSDGMHKITVRATDLAGNYFETYLDIYIDNSNPNTFYPKLSQQSWTNVPPVVTYEATDDYSGIDYYSVKLDDGSFSKQTSPYTFPQLSNGIHNLTIRAYDLVGNYRDESVIAYIDTQQPEFTILSPGNDSWINTTSFTLELQHSDSVSGVKNVLINLNDQIQRDIGNGTSEAFTDYSQGVHKFTITVYDLANNENAQVMYVKVDTLAPLIKIDKPNPNSYFKTTDVEISWFGDDLGSGMNNYWIKLDNDKFMDVGSKTVDKLSGLTEGKHKVFVRGFDLAGNMYEESISFYIDSGKPIINVTEPAENAKITTSEVTIKWSGDDEVSGIDYFEIKLDNENFRNIGKKSRFTFTEITKGPHIVYVRATDSVGNINEYQIEFTVDPSDSPNGKAQSDETSDNWGIIIGIVITMIVILLIIIIFFKNRFKPKAVDSTTSEENKTIYNGKQG